MPANVCGTITSRTWPAAGRSSARLIRNRRHYSTNRPDWRIRPRPKSGSYRSLRVLRCHISRNIQDVGVRHLADNVLHLLRPRTLAVPGLHVGQLADQVIGAASGKPRGILMAAIIIAMAGTTGAHLAAISHRHGAA